MLDTVVLFETHTPETIVVFEDVENILAVQRSELLAAVADNSFAVNGVPLPSLDVSKITDMSQLFYQNYTFNLDVSVWATPQVRTFSSMFWNARGFDQSLAALDISGVQGIYGLFQMLDYCGMSAENYAKTLIGWANRAYNNGNGFGAVGQNLVFTARDVTYSTATFTSIAPSGFAAHFTAAADAKAYLTNTMNWSITDGGAA